MILVIQQLAVRPDKRDELIDLIGGILKPTRVERGCVNYNLCQAVDDERRFFVIEEWRSQKDLEAFIRSASYRRLLVAMELLSEPPVVKINAISYTAGLEAIRAVRERRDEAD